jgi:hypothetical protein
MQRKCGDPRPESHGRHQVLPNTLTVWEEDPYVLEKVAPERTKEIAHEILRIKKAGDTCVANTWKMRRLVLQKR